MAEPVLLHLVREPPGFAVPFSTYAPEGFLVETAKAAGGRAVRREDGGFAVGAGEDRFLAENVVIAMANFQKPRRPGFASELDPAIVQLHSSQYRNLGQLRPGPVLIVGAGNSGAEIAMEAAPSHSVILSGRDTGHIPFRVSTLIPRHVLISHRLPCRLSQAADREHARGAQGSAQDHPRRGPAPG